MNEIPPMSAAEMRVVREFLGLTTLWLSEKLGVAERTIHRWESGVSPIPEGVRLTLEKLEVDTAQIVSTSIDAFNDLSTPRALTYRTDADYREHHPEAAYPASWHRATIARVAQEVPGLEIQYPIRAELRMSPDSPIHATILTYPWAPLEHAGITYVPFGGHSIQGFLSSTTYYPAELFNREGDDQ